MQNLYPYKLFLFKIFTFFLSTCLLSQNYEYIGLIKLNDKIEEAIPYRLIFKNEKGKISGFSITDFTGNHETKNAIEGKYDGVKKQFSFSEKNIIYTKSKISPNSFCFVTFIAKLDIDNPKSKIDGKFYGTFPNKSKCIDGTLALVNNKKVQKFLSKAEKKIEKTDKFDRATKEANNPTKVFDSLLVNRLTKDQNLNIFNKSNNVAIAIWDNKVDDGDAINLFHNEISILKNHTMSNTKFIIERKLLDGINIFKIEAVNQGKAGLNTLYVEITGDKVITLESNLKTKESSTISIINE